MISTKSKLTRQRLRQIRKVMREKNITQPEVAAMFGINTGIASTLMNILQKEGTVYVCGTRPSPTRPARVYALTEKYLATVKPNDPDECEPVYPEIITQVTDVNGKPTFWQRMKTWLFGNPYAGAGR